MMEFKGIITALITPFKGDKIDFPTLKAILERQVAGRVDGIIVAGSTGEGSSLSESEYYELIEKSVQFSDGRTPIIVGVNAVSTFEAINKVVKLSDLGIDGLMCTAPHYIRPEQDGLIMHYAAINDVSKLPIMMYIHPARTGCDFTDETLIEIAKLKKIVAVKDASSDLGKPLRILPKVEGFNMLTGDDPSILAYNANGGSGCVSVVANVFPKLCKKIDNLWRSGSINDALKIQQKLSPLFSAISTESNPIGIKCAATHMNLCRDEIRLPLTKARNANDARIKIALENLISMEMNV